MIFDPGALWSLKVQVGLMVSLKTLRCRPSVDRFWSVSAGCLSLPCEVLSPSGDSCRLSLSRERHFTVHGGLRLCGRACVSLASQTLHVSLVLQCRRCVLRSRPRPFCFRAPYRVPSGAGPLQPRAQFASHRCHSPHGLSTTASAAAAAIFAPLCLSVSGLASAFALSGSALSVP